MSDLTPTTPTPSGIPVPNLSDPPVSGLELHVGEAIPSKRVRAWAMWDWATQPFNSVIITFVYTALYLTSSSFLEPAVAALDGDDPVKVRALAGLTSGLGMWMTVAGILIAVLAPVLGQRADVAGSRKKWLGGATIGLIVCMFALFFVEADPSFFVLGAILIALGAVLNEIAGVNYNAMIVQVSTPSTVGRVSGLGWGLGYVGGIVALVIVVVLDTFDWFGMDTSNGMAYRLIAVGCAVWAIVFGWPIFRYVPEAVPARERPRVGFFRSYAVLWHDIVELFRNSRTTFWFLISSAVYRDGLAGVFAFGAIIGSVAFGFSSQEVIVFGIAANLVAGVSTILVGRLDDRLGARRVIIGSLAILVAAGLSVVFLHGQGKLVFWIGGLALCCVVGPAQSASRSFLARVTPRGLESEIFGLYAFTGRAASFLSPALWSIFIAVTGATIWGTLGIILVVLAGLILLIVSTPSDRVVTTA
ncbi:major facilitator superfamily MFS_1 [Xylanimonas cellulosilytica DSM 15894]|uniref:Major facilitator superfamily MFS_1 n=1 Tax=Xylanimonas cellulosilytica (strain DSM 15894 / JCM 12276 / CECT 5975 / KCTC 9989 / LMG 20990 / NBRC 107835 / XIL07) TaxID=446471 RepID=D1BSN1_XYLCX|nr:MFS transporter [Xylanimonas cellulosilytica]ACZ30723.1 major facilitator superfamily MFS_1 [Xylanimonas cellulosilytica DSM 15894]